MHLSTPAEQPPLTLLRQLPSYAFQLLDEETGVHLDILVGHEQLELFLRHVLFDRVEEVSVQQTHLVLEDGRHFVLEVGHSGELLFVRLVVLLQKMETVRQLVHPEATTHPRHLLSECQTPLLDP